MQIQWLTDSMGEMVLSCWNLLQSYMDLFYSLCQSNYKEFRIYSIKTRWKSFPSHNAIKSVPHPAQAQPAKDKAGVRERHSWKEFTDLMPLLDRADEQEET